MEILVAIIFIYLLTRQDFREFLGGCFLTIIYFIVGILLLYWIAGLIHA